jgi:hypothetical protein
VLGSLKRSGLLLRIRNPELLLDQPQAVIKFGIRDFPIGQLLDAIDARVHVLDVTFDGFDIYIHRRHLTLDHAGQRAGTASKKSARLAKRSCSVLCRTNASLGW